MNLFRLWLALLLAPLFGHAAFPTLFLKNVCDDQLHAPTNITHAGDGSGRLFICDQMGKIYIFKGGMLLPTPFLNIASPSNSVPNDGPGPVIVVNTGYTERGLLGMCFHPDFENEGSPGYRCFYVNYTAPDTHPTLNPVVAGGSTNCVTVIAEYKASLTNPDIADPASARIVLTYGQPQSNHNGGQLEFGPDGYLYIASGDGGSANDNALGHTQGTGTATASPGRVSGALGNGQDRRTLLGKILRIDPHGTNGPGGTYGIPASNPFVGQTQNFTDDSLDGPMRGEIYAYGMRNPWRFSFDSDFGGAPRLICADVGQLDVEEIDFITSGGNYGWRIKEGTADFDTITAYGGSPPSVIPPVAQYTHRTPTLLPATSIVGTSITGGYVYRGGEIPELQGKYLFADYAVNGIGGGGGVILGLEETGPGVFTLSNINIHNPLPTAARIYAFGVDESGEMYVAAKTTNGVLGLDGGKPAGTLYKIQALTDTNLTLNADRDATIYEQTTAPWKSDSRGPSLLSGRSGQNAGEAARRSLVHFNTSTIPPGVTLNSASVTMTLTIQITEGQPGWLHKVTADWGEGNSNAGLKSGLGANATTNDPTWSHRFFSTQSWTSLGGDFVVAPSATRTIGNYLSQPQQVWSSAQLLADVQGWVSAPATNFGWMLITDESFSYSGQRWASRHYGVSPNPIEVNASSYWPKLTVSYTAVPQPTPYEAWFAANFPTSPPGTFLNPSGDNDGDGIANQIEYAYGFSPVSYNPPGSDQFSTELVPGFDDSTDYTITFRRDSSATDLTYNLQTSEDLLGWTTIATSTGGALTMGDNGGNVMSDMVVSGTIRLVTVSENLAAGSNEKRFVRLEVLRTP